MVNGTKGRFNTASHSLTPTPTAELTTRFNILPKDLSIEPPMFAPVPFVDSMLALVSSPVVVQSKICVLSFICQVLTSHSGSIGTFSFQYVLVTVVTEENY